MTDPAYQQWWQQFLQGRQQAYQGQIAALANLMPWQHGLGIGQAMPNALLNPSAAGNARILDPGNTIGGDDQQSMLPYFMGMMR